MGDFFNAVGLFWWCFQVLLFDQLGFFSRIIIDNAHPFLRSPVHGARAENQVNHGSSAKAPPDQAEHIVLMQGNGQPRAASGNPVLWLIGMTKNLNRCSIFGKTVA